MRSNFLGKPWREPTQPGRGDCVAHDRAPGLQLLSFSRATSLLDCAIVGLTRSIPSNYNDCDHNECRDQRKNPIKCFRAGLCGGRVERRHDKNFLVLTYFRSLSAGVHGTLRSLCYQPIASDFIGSAFNCASWISLHSVHRRVQCSNPKRAEVIC